MQPCSLHYSATPRLAPTIDDARKAVARPTRRFARIALFAAALAAASACAADDAPRAPRPAFDAVDLPGDRAFPESVAATADGTLFIGSIGQGGIVRLAPGATAPEPWLAPGEGGTRSTFGLLADDAAGLLWVCSNDLTAIGVHVPGTATGSWLKGFDLVTREVRVSARFPNAPALCNEIALGPDGSVFVTNTLAPEILALSADRKTLQVWASGKDLPQPEDGPGLDGIAFGDDGHLYVNSYGKGGLFRVAVEHGKAGAVTRLRTSRPLVMPDTLRLEHGTTFLMIEGGGRLDRIVVAGDHVGIETLADGFALPTSFAVAGGKAWVSEGQLDYIFDAAKKDQAPTLPFRLYAVPLRPSATTP